MLTLPRLSDDKSFAGEVRPLGQVRGGLRERRVSSRSERLPSVGERRPRCGVVLRGSDQLRTGALAPVVDDKDTPPVIARFVGTVHAHTLDLGPEASGAHLTIGLFTSQADACFNASQAHSVRE